MKICFKDLKLIDATGADIQEGLCMVVENGVITALCKEVPSDCDKTVSLGDKYVIPGLMDCHIHMSMGMGSADGSIDMSAMGAGNDYDRAAYLLINLNKMAKQGVTYIREAGAMGTLPPDLTLKKYIEQGYFVGSHVCSSGKIITMTGGHGSNSATDAPTTGMIADGPAECVKATRTLLQMGVDVIKTVATGGVGTEGSDINAYQYEIEELQAIVREAHKAGRKVMVHAHGPVGIKNALIAGVDSIEHCTLIDDEGIEMMVKNGAYLTATFVIQDWISSAPKGLPKYMVEKEKIINEQHKINFKKCYEAGVKIACGTDMSPTTVPYCTAKEVELMVKNSGMSNMEGLQTATRNAAELIGVLDKYGTLEVGKVADFVVLNENPLADIRALQTAQHSVYMGGKMIHCNE